MKQHKHAELIKAWADGAMIESKVTNSDGPFWIDAPNPIWADHVEYRVKPEPRPDVVERMYFHEYGCSYHFCISKECRHNLRLTFDGETGQLKSAEVLK